MGVRYASREQVMAALDIAETVRTAPQIDRLLDAASRSVERLTHRKFFPQTATRYVDWPTSQLGTSYRIWLDGDHELISVTSIVSDGQTITDYFLEPQGSGPPYTRIELDRSGSDVWGGATEQRAIAITGVFGACADLTSAGTLAEALDTTETEIDCGSITVGVGDTIKVDDEYMQVTARALITTGATLNGAVTASKAVVSLTLTGTYTLTAGETITVDSERMLVVDAYDTTAVVERAWSGSALAAHSNGATVRAPRRLTVTRGQLGTTAATHSNGATVYRHTPPPLVEQLTIAETLVALGREQSGYARTIGVGEATRAAPGGDLRDLRDAVYTAHGRKTRKAAV